MLKIFLVEDSTVVRELIIEQLNDVPNVTCVGYADSEMSAIEALRHTACNVVSLDIKLKSGTGINVLHALAAFDSPHSSTTRIIFSNFSDPDVRALADRAGATAFFDKTYDFPKYLALISGLASADLGSAM